MAAPFSLYMLHRALLTCPPPRFTCCIRVQIVSDNIAYAKAIKLMGTRENAASLDFSGILEEDVEAHLKDAAKISMGTEISGEDLSNIHALCDQVRQD